jgi:hypothetical protein
MSDYAEMAEKLAKPPELNKLHQGMTYEEYAAKEGLRASDLKWMKQSPAHLRQARSQPEKRSEALDFGKLFHLAIEHGKKFLEMYIIEPVFEGRTKDGRLTTSLNCKEVREKKDAWHADLKPGAVVVKQAWVEPLKGMMRSCLEHRLVGNLLRNGVRETSLWVEDPDTGVTLKCRPDFISEKGFLVDIKTTRDARPAFFRGQIFSDRYDGDPFYVLQAAHYAHCARVSGAANGESFIIIAIEKEPPYGIMVYPLDVGCLGPGEQWRAELTNRYARCDAQGKWPCYDERAVPVTPPEWVALPGGES